MGSIWSEIILVAPVDPGPAGENLAKFILSWLKWIGGMCGIGGFFVIAIQMMVGRRNRSQMASDGFSALPWVAGGFIIIGLTAGLTEALLDIEPQYDDFDVPNLILPSSLID